MTEITLQNNLLNATVRFKGAELVSLRDAKGRDYMWEGRPDVWGKHAPVLFPIVGTLKDNQYRYNGVTYTMGRHGFARDKTFSLEQQSGSEAVFLLTDDAETRAMYPFAFEFRIRYRLSDSTLTVTYEVRNTDTSILFFSVGGHPAFALPQAFDSYSVAVEPAAVLTYRLLDRDLLSDETAELDATSGHFALDYRLFERDALVFTSQSCKTLTIREEGHDLLSVDLRDFPDVGLWTKPGAPFLCIEPWHGYADTTDASGVLENKKGIRQLASGQDFHTAYTIKIHVP
ncbi:MULTISPECIES: aldose 1-epimerase family protein [unclassified Flavobacterium]|uniref:aldose 1-epimerase family protein n=1 Tax=unclassified Flavobacterium TaxID=196869 RepID=UPI001F143F37|nr:MULTISPECIES: aldose 1-epimerase family protein [unclassified Flavobacterium]UMY64434.1 aldose 1-epimerase family protein [Flavobacterium sp. HJ-32-4]